MDCDMVTFCNSCLYPVHDQYLELLMPQINLNTTPEFEQQLATLMRLKSLATKSDAIRLAVAAQARAAEAESLRRDFSQLIGIAKSTRTGLFDSDAALWDGDEGH
jgi:hypothetical protein